MAKPPANSRTMPAVNAATAAEQTRSASPSRKRTEQVSFVKRRGRTGAARRGSNTSEKMSRRVTSTITPASDGTLPAKSAPSSTPTASAGVSPTPAATAASPSG